MKLWNTKYFYFLSVSFHFLPLVNSGTQCKNNNNGLSEFIELLSPPLNKNKPEQPTEPIFITYSRKSQHHLAAIKAQNSSSTPPEQQPTESTNETATTPIGFGSVSTSSPAKKQKGKKERSRIIQREPVEAPKFVTQQKEQRASDEQQGSNERAFLLMWLGLGSFNRRNKGRRMSSRGATSGLFFLRG
ncbi:putative protein LOW PSII ACCUMULATION 2 [Helianthus annuus]|nr:putative protein LOW PSII ACCUMULATION 2 [Helianthus annuus]